MNIIIVQVVVFAIMVVLFGITAYKDRQKMSVKDVSVVALLCVLNVVLSKALSIKITPAAPILVISLASVVSITIGILYSPKISLLAGLVIDLIGVLIAPATGDGSMPFLGFTLTAMLACFIPSVCSRYFKDKSKKLVITALVSTVILAIISISFIIFNNDVLSLDNKTKIVLDSSHRTLIMSSIIGIFALVIILSRVASIKLKDKVIIDINVLTLIILLEQLICSVILTSFWINIMYGVPLVVGVGIRLIKMVISLPIFIILTTTLVSFLKKRKIV
ncbi:MAG: folate family ECF transporter S component [Erysipelotrichales bacterium]